MKSVLRVLARGIALLLAIPFGWYGFGVATWYFAALAQGVAIAAVGVFFGLAFLLYGLRLFAFAVFGDGWMRALWQRALREGEVAG